MDGAPDAATALRGAIAADLQALAALHDREPSEALLTALRDAPDAQWLALTPEREPARAGLQSMRAALDSLSGRSPAAALDALAADFADIYLLFALRAAPSESPWFDDEGLERQAAMFAVRGWYRRHGVAAADWRKRPDDHLVTELEFLAHLVATQPVESWPVTAAAFLDAHPLRWIPDFASRVAARCATRFYAGLALLTRGYLEELRDLLVTLGAPPPSRATPAPRRRRAAAAAAGCAGA